MIVRLMERLLADAGFRTVVARDGEAALRCVQQEQPALVVLDVMMPKLDGIAVTRALRSVQETSAIPIILVSARAMPADVELGRDAGADDYVLKPFGLDDLLKRINALLA